MFTACIGAALAAALAALPELRVVDTDANGCGRPVRVWAGQQIELALPTDALCVHGALTARLEGAGPLHAVLTVSLPGDASARRRLFIYRLEGRRLRPRYLGSGPDHLELLRVAREAGRTPADPDALLLVVRDRRGQAQQLRCAFQGFSLLCAERAGERDRQGAP